jgi:hypothetical protein
VTILLLLAAGLFLDMILLKELEPFGFLLDLVIVLTAAAYFRVRAVTRREGSSSILRSSRPKYQGGR